MVTVKRFSTDVINPKGMYPDPLDGAILGVVLHVVPLCGCAGGIAPGQLSHQGRGMAARHAHGRALFIAGGDITGTTVTIVVLIVGHMLFGIGFTNQVGSHMRGLLCIRGKTISLYEDSSRWKLNRGPFE